MSRTTKIILAALGLVVLAGLGGGGYAMKHNADVKAAQKRARDARIARVNREYRDDLARWKSDLDEWDRKESDYTSCQTATSDVFDAADSLSGVIASGGKYDEYHADLTSFATEISGAAREATGNFDCLMVIDALQSASDQVNKGLNIWLTWMRGDDFQYAESPDDLPGMDTHFTKAQDKIDDAQSALSDMQPVGGEPEKPTRGRRYVTTVES